MVQSQVLVCVHDVWHSPGMNCFHCSPFFHAVLNGHTDVVELLTAGVVHVDIVRMGLLLFYSLTLLLLISDEIRKGRRHL